MWLLALTVSAVAQTADSSDTAAQHAKKSKGEVTVQGCVSKLNTDYILMKTDPGNSNELQSRGKLHLRDYLGQQVEVAG